ncbi:hypothetical protein V6N13_136943 [Hibiscus sabdariffa]|uniref:Uncharacterized protein n=1 Tax=Hibiscus sabdariffa TaxID=183260 RepID=A0ABR2DMJ6_9ROSI
MELSFSIGEGDDNIQAYLFKAMKNDNGAGVLLLYDVFGFQDSASRDFAYQVACHGYNVLFQTYFAVIPKQRAGRKQWLANQYPRRVANGIATSTKWMVDEFSAAGIQRNLASLILFRRLPSDRRDDDPLCPVSVLSEFEKIVGKGSRVVIFNVRGHAFAHRPGSVEEDEDAEQAFTLMMNWCIFLAIL